jgi:hypothetical protein
MTADMVPICGFVIMLFLPFNALLVGAIATILAQFAVLWECTEL